MSTSTPSVQPTRQQFRAASRRHSKSSRRRLAGYLTATAGCCGLATTSDAAVVAIDIVDTGVPNAGLAPDEQKTLFTVGGDVGFGAQNLYQVPGNYNGLWTGFYITSSRGQFAFTNSGASYYIAKFPTGNSIDENFSASGWEIARDSYNFQFRYNFDFNGQNYTWQAPDWGSGSYAGFRFGTTGSWNYGYIEATWNTTTQTFVILSAAYETDVNVPILAGAVPVPEPGTAAMAFGAVASLCLGGRAFSRWKKDRRREQPQEQPASVA